MSLTHIAELRDALARDDGDDSEQAIAAHERLAHAEVAYMAVQCERVRAAQARLRAAQQRKRELLAAAAATTTTTTTSVAENTCSSSSSNENDNDADKHRRTLDAYKHEWLRWLRVLATRREVLRYVLAYSAADVRVADITVVSRWLDTWGAFFREVKAALKALKAQAHELTSATAVATTTAALPPPLQTLYDALDDVCRLQLQARSLIGRERYRRSAANEDAVDELVDSAAQLVEWCEAQSSTLASLTRLADVQPFASSLAANVPVMSSNFLVLLEQAAPVASHRRVLPALQAANAAWTRLCVQTYRSVRTAVVDAHTHSPLEAMCDAWLYGASNRSHSSRSNSHTATSVGSGVAAAHELLTLAHRLLDADADSDRSSGQQHEHERAQLRAQCAALRRDAAAHTTLCTHLSNMTLREGCVRAHVEALCDELVSDTATTVLCFGDDDAVVVERAHARSGSSSGGAAAAAGSGVGKTSSSGSEHASHAAATAELRSRMDELREWIEVKSQKGTYLKLLERLEETQHLVEDYADVLFPDADASDKDDDDTAAVTMAAHASHA